MVHLQGYNQIMTKDKRLWIVSYICFSIYLYNDLQQPIIYYGLQKLLLTMRIWHTMTCDNMYEIQSFMTAFYGVQWLKTSYHVWCTITCNDLVYMMYIGFE